MKNVTITVEEDVARWARVWAAERNTSVSRILGELLKEKMQREARYARAKASFFSRKPKKLKKSQQSYPKRTEIYDR